jgi:Protein of unknown function (DUF3060)
MTLFRALVAGTLLILGSVQVQTVQAQSVKVGPGGLSVNVGTPSPSAAAYALTGSGQTQTYTCRNTQVNILGSDNRITLNGSCRDVAVTGSHNTVSVATLGRLAVMGSVNTVTWHRGLNGRRPAIAVTGTDNKVSQR